MDSFFKRRIATTLKKLPNTNPNMMINISIISIKIHPLKSFSFYNKKAVAVKNDATA